ncbi:MAG TPA: 1-acyl-sn-glycerol-3-phosphate acyltransferase [Mycobacterium sp.]|nr:1-acyl-sn-glycerol-3-phosphate acyltransferase [Mycobacterium sp.]
MPLVTASMVCVLVSGPLLLAVTALAGLMMKSTRPVRSAALAMAYACIELRTLFKLATGDLDGDGLAQEFLTAAYTAARRILDVEVLLDPASATPDIVPRHEPVIVLSRHCGPGDSVLVAWLLTTQYRLQVRAVLKAILRFEPVLDYAGQLGCLCFIARGGRARKQIQDLAASLSGGQALLLFPEGANFSWPRWRAAIAELRSTGRIRAARRALRQSHTLPPHTGGVTAAVTGAPGAHVLVLTHNGFCSDGRARPWWQLPVHRKLLVRTALVPAEHLLQTDQLGTWLEQTWTQVDAWVAGHTDQSDPRMDSHMGLDGAVN